MRFFHSFASGILLVVLFAQCRKTPALSSNADLQQADLPTIQAQASGHWKLVQITGGLCASCEHPVPPGSYMDLSPTRVTFGNAAGVVEEGAISWQPAGLLGSGYYFEGPSGNGYQPVALHEGELQLQQYANDGVTYHYVR